MSRRILTVLFIIACLLVSNSLYAQSTVVTLGGSWWNAAYSYEDEDGEKIADIGNGNNFGPYVSINHGKLNFGASLLFGTFPIEDIEMTGELSDDESYDMSRSDLNFTLGYRIHRYINIFAGAKYLKWGFEYNYEYTDGYYDENWNWISGASESASIEYTESGMLYGVGLSGVVPLGSEGLYLFGSVAGMGGTMTPETSYSSDSYSESEEGDGISATLVAINMGLGYRFPSGFGINAGYRADLFTETFEDQGAGDYDESIRVQGLMITASYSF